MKIGVAISGCDIGGVCAYEVLNELEQQGIQISMLSVSGIPAMTALLYAYGCGEERYRQLAGEFLGQLEKRDLDTAISALSEGFSLRAGNRIPLAVNTVNVSDGQVFTFTNDYQLQSDQLKTLPLKNAYDAFSAAISPLDGLSSYSYGGHELCDYSTWYGCPVAPLHLAGMEQVLSLAFVPEHPHTPYEAMIKRRIMETAALADWHRSLEFAGGEQSLVDYARNAVLQIDSCKNDMVLALYH